MSRLSGLIEKGWGSEFIWVTNDHYCSKFLNFNTGSKFSMHFHTAKHESWYVLNGRFLLETIDTKTAEITGIYLEKGSIWINEPLLPHRLTCIDEGTIIEVSTPDSVEDNYRVLPGDSQKSVISSMHQNHQVP